MVYKPPPKRKMAYATVISVIAKAEGSAVEILRNQRLSENDMDDALLLTFFDTSSSLAVN
jgi:hypothetical protein